MSKIFAPTNLDSMRNIGPKTAQRLAEVGVTDIPTLKELGPVEAFCRLKTFFPDSVSFNALFAIQAAMLDVDWRDLPAGLKEELTKEAYSMMSTTRFEKG